MLRRPIFGKILAVAQIVFSIACFAIAAYLFLSAPGMEKTIRETEGAAEAQGVALGLRIAGAEVLVFAAAVAVAGRALLQRKRWGWWCGLAIFALTDVAIAYSIWDERKHPDESMYPALVFSAIATLWFFLPGVRDYLVAAPAAAQPIADSTENSPHG